MWVCLKVYACLTFFTLCSINRNVIPTSVRRFSLRGQPLNLALTSKIIGVKYRLWVGGKVFVCERVTSKQKTMLATVKGKVLIGQDDSSCVAYQNIWYYSKLFHDSNLFTLTYVILLAYQQTILSWRGRQAAPRWPPLNTSFTFVILLLFGILLSRYTMVWKFTIFIPCTFDYRWYRCWLYEFMNSTILLLSNRTIWKDFPS